jgi:hypothetical protein
MSISSHFTPDSLFIIIELYSIRFYINSAIDAALKIIK